MRNKLIIFTLCATLSAQFAVAQSDWPTTKTGWLEMYLGLSGAQGVPPKGKVSFNFEGHAEVRMADGRATYTELLVGSKGFDDKAKSRLLVVQETKNGNLVVVLPVTVMPERTEKHTKYVNSKAEKARTYDYVEDVPPGRDPMRPRSVSNASRTEALPAPAWAMPDSSETADYVNELGETADAWYIGLRKGFRPWALLAIKIFWMGMSVLVFFATIFWYVAKVSSGETVRDMWAYSMGGSLVAIHERSSVLLFWVLITIGSFFLFIGFCHLVAMNAPLIGLVAGLAALVIILQLVTNWIIPNIKTITPGGQPTRR